MGSDTTATGVQELSDLASSERGVGWWWETGQGGINRSESRKSSGGQQAWTVLRHIVRVGSWRMPGFCKSEQRLVLPAIVSS